MINGVIRWCLNNHFLVFLFTAVIVGLGWYCLTNIPVDAIPDIGEKQVIVFTDWPGRSPQDVEDQVTYPLTSVCKARRVSGRSARLRASVFR